MSFLHYSFDRDIPLLRQADVVITGAGPAGISAALTAAEFGCKTILIEKSSLPGGMAFLGEVSPFMLNHFGEKSLDHPIYTRWLQKMISYRSSASNDYIAERIGPKWGRLYINKNYAALSAEDMLEAAGVETLYEYTFFDTVMDEKNIRAVILHSRSGLCAVSGKIFIDASGDGVLSAAAGCPVAVGNADGQCQPMTWCFKVAPVDIPDEDFWTGPWRKEIQEAYRKAKAAGILSCPRENVLMFQCCNNSMVHFNTTRVVMHDPTDAESYRQAGKIARQQIRELLDFLRKEVRGFANADIISMGQQLGIRESRRILGDFILTAEVFRNKSKFPDAIARCNYPIDIHSPSGAGTRYEPMGYDDFYEIPYRCLIPGNCRNLLTCGRIISSDHVINSSLRVMPVCCATGQAAGAGAAVALRMQCAPGDVDGRIVREELIRFGAHLGDLHNL
ncbi:MAG: FAD-dependent oxidoreductase [Lentisphaerae bacterium]|nr:FAD-dependent oxidoreductase [Lentisphaerota bacterium]